MNNKNIAIDEINIGKVLNILRRSWKAILLISIVIFSLVSLYAYFAKPIYKSNVIISLTSDSNKKIALEDMLFENTIGSGGIKDERLQLAQVTLKSKKFIETVVDKLDIEQNYFIKKNFKQIEMLSLPGLKVDIEYKENSSTNIHLKEELFEIIPIDNNTFTLQIDAIDYTKNHTYNERIETNYFILRIIREREGPINGNAYLFNTNNRKKQIENILLNLNIKILSDNILQINYTDTIAIRAKSVVEEIANSYIKYNLDNKTNELEQTLQFVNKQIIEIKLNLSNEGNKLKNYQQKSGEAVMGSSSSLLQLIEKRKEAVKRTKIQIKEVDKFIKNLKNNNQLNIVSLTNSGVNLATMQYHIENFIKSKKELRELYSQKDNITKSISSNPLIVNLINDLRKEEKKLTEYRSTLKDQHPAVVQQIKIVEKLKSKIYLNIITNLKNLEKTKTISTSSILSNINMVTNNLQNRLRLQESNLREKVALLESIPEKSLVNENLKSNFDLSKNIYVFLLRKKVEIEISIASTIANTKIIENANVPDKPIRPNKLLILLLGLIVGLILGIAFSFLRELFDTKIRDAHDVELLTDIPLYGTLPNNKNQRFFEESLRHIRTNLQFVPTTNSKCTTLLISSSVAGEGKTTISAGLGKILAQTQKRILLIDLDLRKPKLHEELQQSNKVGMSNLLSDTLPKGQFVLNIDKNFDFISAGPIPPNPSELLMTNRLENLLKKLKDKYDYIILDTPPIGSVTDANIILKYSDIVLLVARANKAEKVYLKYFNKMVTEKNIKSSGIILNDVKLYKTNDGYGYGYGYGYDYNYGVAKKDQ